MGGVIAFDVESRIGFGITEALSFLQAIGKGQAFLLHLGEDVVAGAVHDAVDARDRVACQGFTQRLDDRDAAGNGRFEVQERALLLRNRRKLDAVIGKQRLVGGHHMETTGKSGANSGICSPFSTADQLDEHVDIGLFGQFFRAFVPGDAGQIDATVLRAITRRNCRNRNRSSAGDCKFIAFLPDDANKRGTNGAQARNADFEGICHGSILKCLVRDSRKSAAVFEVGINGGR